jgi:hypothetical protein
MSETASALAVRPATAADILAAIRRAPARPLTQEERSLLAEHEGQPVRWLSHEEIVAGLGSHDDPR